MSDTETQLYIVTADKIADTGTVSWKMMFELPQDRQPEVLSLHFGYVWKPEREEHRYPYTVFTPKGFHCSGGFEEASTDEWIKKNLDAIPPAVMLMRTDVFEWVNQHVLEKFDRTFERFHVDKIIATS